MPELYTDEILRVASVALHAMWTSHPDECLDCKDDMAPVLDAVAPLIAARAQIDILRRFAEHDIHGVLPHGDISNDWYHRGIDGAQDEARVWIEYVEDGVFRVRADEIEAKR